MKEPFNRDESTSNKPFSASRSGKQYRFIQDPKVARANRRQINLSKKRRP